MNADDDKACGPGTRCRCSPCRCAQCGDVIGLYEPLVAELGDDVMHASLISIDRVGPRGNAIAYHDGCYRQHRQAAPRT